jgi:hypothetical protein
MATVKCSADTKRQLAQWLGYTPFLTSEEQTLGSIGALLELGAGRQALFLLEQVSSQTEFVRLYRAKAHIAVGELETARSLLSELSDSSAKTLQLARLAWYDNDFNGLNVKDIEALTLESDLDLKAHAHLLLGWLAEEKNSDFEEALYHWRLAERYFAKQKRWWGLTAVHLSMAQSHHHQALQDPKQYYSLATAQEYFDLIQIPDFKQSNLLLQYQQLAALPEFKSNVNQESSFPNLIEQIGIQSQRLAAFKKLGEPEKALDIQRQLEDVFDSLIALLQTARLEDT